MDILAAVAEERERVADWLATLEPEQWSTPSCCGGWTITEVTAHLLVGPVRGTKGAFPFMLKARGNLAKAQDLMAVDIAATMSNEELVAELRRVAASPFTPPGFGPEAPLTDTTIHGQDMSRPLGVDLGVPTDRWRFALDTATSVKYGPISVRRHLKGLSFRSNDLDWAWGDGPAVHGAAKDLAHAMWGRASALDALEGEGVEALRSRLRR